jgi:hypothetical protein
MQINIIYWSGTGNTKFMTELIRELSLGFILLIVTRTRRQWSMLWVVSREVAALCCAAAAAAVNLRCCVVSIA